MKNLIKKGAFCAVLCSLTIFPLLARDHSTDPNRYYLELTEVVNSKELLPPPPAESSKWFAYDIDRYEWGKSIRDTERGRRAVVDADLSDGWLDRDFSEAFGFKLTPDNAPEICKLLENMKEDAGDLCTRACKQYYMRRRPFMYFNEPTATPDHEPALRVNGSYPSGHTAIGWAAALVLAEINPDRNFEIIQRGYDYGDSRVIVGAHWQSDVDAGRVVGAAVVSTLHSDENFQKQLKKAKKEFVKLSKNISKKVR